MKKRVTTLLVASAVLFACGLSYGAEKKAPSNYKHLKAFGAKIGTWVYEGPLQEDGPEIGKEEGAQMVVKLSYKWILKRNAVEINWTIAFEDTVGLAGKNIVCWDPASQQIVGGNVDSNGAHGMSKIVISEDGKKWTSKGEGVASDGTKTTSTIVHTLTDPDTLVWQAFDRTGKEPTGDSPKYVFKLFS